MCGRCALNNITPILKEFPDLDVIDPQEIENVLPRYNASPTQHMPVIIMLEGRPAIRIMHWGLIPHWAKEEKMNFSTFNARSETIDKSRLYGPYFKNSRCLVPVDAFYEWRKVGKVGKKAGGKTPFCIRMKDENTFLLAGVYSIWRDEEEIEHPTFSIITTGPNELMAEIHDRMPVILPKENWRDWLQTGKKDTDALKQMLLPFPPQQMKAYPVSKFVSSSKNEGIKCMEPVRETGTATHLATKMAKREMAVPVFWVRK